MPEPSRKQLEAQAEAAARATRVRRLPRRPVARPAPLPSPSYAELHCLSHFSFQRGASSPEELVRRAWALGYTALAITDECSVAGAVRAWQALADLERSRDAAVEDPELAALHAARAALGVAAPLQLIHGAEFRFDGQGTLVALARDLAGWGELCQFISRARQAAPKGRYDAGAPAVAMRALQGCALLWAPWRETQNALYSIAACAHWMRANAGFDVEFGWLLELHGDADDALWLAALQQASRASGRPLVAAGDVQMHVRARKRLHDVLCAIRLGRPVNRCGFALQPNAEHHLRPLGRLARIYPPDALVATLALAARCRFRLDEVRYNYPRESVLPGLTPTQTLRRHATLGAHRRLPQGVPLRIWRYVAKELALIAECRYEMFFLTVHDIVREARARGILCQGRGSAANSVVCWCLGITEADPRFSHPLLERFISRARRHEPPDIDVDFEHERREEVIQYIYAKYGRARAALAAAVITWRTRSALRGVGMALGVDARLVDAVARDHHGFDAQGVGARLAGLAAGLNLAPSPELMRLWLELAAELKGTPRHLSQHVGGFVLTETPLTRLVPVEPASMEGRSVIQWDKDDLEALGLLKVDVLALGMLTAIRRCLDLVSRWRGAPFTRADIVPEDVATYAMVRRADTVGTFQIESRAQMSMLPRLKPSTFYDLVVQVAIVRPGPITGGMVHPYLKARERARRGLPIEYERSRLDVPGAPPLLAKALGRTLGVPIFQEQVMELSMLAAGFSAEQADRLRRAMAAWKRKGGLEPFERALIEGMRARGYSADFARRIFEQIKGFGEYGFPESHAYSFALIAYESAWLKCHQPEAYLAALLNSQPMGFYGPAQLVQDARRHGVAVLPTDVAASDWDCTLEAADPATQPSQPALARDEAGAAVAEGGPHWVAASPAAPRNDVERQAAPMSSSKDRPAMPSSRAAQPRGDPATTLMAEPTSWMTTPPTAPGSDQLQTAVLPRPAVRLGLRLVAGLAEAAAQRIVAARADAPFVSVQDLARRARLDAQALGQLAAADALASLAGHRRQQAWQSAAWRPMTPLLHDAPIRETPLSLPAAPEGEAIVHDYAALGLTLRRHPLALLRPRLARWRLLTADELSQTPHGRSVRACGLVVGRQRPVTANGTIFVTLEDETGPVNVIVWPGLREDEDQRHALLRARLLAVEGQWQRDAGSGGAVRHLIASRLRDLTPLLGRLAELTTSRDFH
ncbi:MAG: error-prone DNA polymerase [Ottowia sp.]|nr:MAG: error-prone DNA polymerase [Ottowia sp.]